MSKIALTAEEDSRVRRLAISYFDLDEASGFIGALARHSRNDSDYVNVRDALLLGFIVAYSRPFKRNRANGNVDPRLDWESLNISDAEMKRHHDFLLRVRDENFAHSDPTPLNLSIEQGFEGAMEVRMREARPPVSTTAHEAYGALAQTVRESIQQQLRTLGVLRLVREG